MKAGYMKEDRLPAFALDTVRGTDLNQVKAQWTAGVPMIVLRNAEDISVYRSTRVADMHVDRADQEEL